MSDSPRSRPLADAEAATMAALKTPRVHMIESPTTFCKECGAPSQAWIKPQRSAISVSSDWLPAPSFCFTR